MHNYYAESVKRYKVEIDCFETHFFILLCFILCVRDQILWWLMWDYISVKTLLSVSLTCSLMPCVCFTNLFYQAFSKEGTKPLRGCYLLSHAVKVKRKKSAPFFLSLCPFLVPQASWRTPADSYGWMGNNVGMCLHSLMTFSLSFL